MRYKINLIKQININTNYTNIQTFKYKQTKKYRLCRFFFFKQLNTNCTDIQTFKDEQTAKYK